MKANYCLILVLLLGCSPTKRAINEADSNIYFYDKNFFQLDLPISYTALDLDSEMYSLDTAGYLNLSKYTLQQRPVFTITKKAMPYVAAEYSNDYFRDSRIESQNVAVFNYYRLKRVQLKTMRFLGNARDTLEATFKVDYDVIPMFSIGDNPSYPKIKFIKNGKGWKVENFAKAHSEIYNFAGAEKWRKTLSFRRPYTYRAWRDSVMSSTKNSEQKIKYPRLQ